MSSTFANRLFWWLRDHALLIVGIVIFAVSLDVLVRQNIAIARSLPSWGLITLPLGWDRWVGLFGVTGGALVILLLVNRRRSRLNHQQKNALQLEVRNPRHLAGRHDRVNDLIRSCGNHELMFLSGDSGVGKTALLLAGFVPKTKDDPNSKLFPIYIDSFGPDWVKGPYFALVRAIDDALTPSLRSRIGFSHEVDEHNFGTILTAIYSKMHRIPVIIFDQFDDYQLQFRDKFYIDGTWINENELVERNKFWKQIRSLLTEDHGGRVHCIFATRSDLFNGLGSVQFVRYPARCDIVPIASKELYPLIEVLTSTTSDGQDVVFYPNNGWTELRERLVKDLSTSGTVLPVQLKLALRGLEQLRFLTISDYERAGGLTGLEVTHVLFHVRNAAKSANISDAQLLELLRHFVEPGSRKTTPRTIRQLLDFNRQITGDLNTSQVKSALEQLATFEVVRKRLPQGKHSEASWSLDHDYLCQAVLEASRSISPGVEEATAWYARYQEANGFGKFWTLRAAPWGCWRAVCRPSLCQSRVFWFLVKGLVARAAMLAILGVLVSGWIKSSQQTRTAENLLYDTTKEKWSMLARAPEPIRHRYVELALSKRKLAKEMVSAPQALRAIVGIDIKRRDALLHDVLDKCADLHWLSPGVSVNRREDIRTAVDCRELIYRLRMPVIKPTYKYLNNSLLGTCSSDPPSALDYSLDRAVAQQIERISLLGLDQTEASALMTRLGSYIMVAMEPGDPEKRPGMATKYLTRLRQKLPCRKESLRSLIGLMSKYADQTPTSDLVSVYQTLTEMPLFEYGIRVPVEQMDVLEKLFARLASRMSSDQLRTIGPERLLLKDDRLGFVASLLFQETPVALKPAVARLPIDDVISPTHRIFGQVLEHNISTNPELLEVLSARWPDELVAATVTDVTKRLAKHRGTETEYPLSLLAGMRTLFPRLPAAARLQTIQAISKAFSERAGITDALPSAASKYDVALSETLTVLAKHLTEEQRPRFLQEWWNLFVSELDAFDRTVLRYEEQFSAGYPMPFLPTLERFNEIEKMIIDIGEMEKWNFAVLKPTPTEIFDRIVSAQRAHEKWRSIYIPRLRFLGGMLPAELRNSYNEKLLGLGESKLALVVAKGYDGFGNALCKDRMDLLRAALTAPITSQADIYPPMMILSLNCKDPLSDRDLNETFELLAKSGWQLGMRGTVQDDIASRIVRAIQCNTKDCLEKIARIHAADLLRRGSLLAEDPESTAYHKDFWPLTWGHAVSKTPVTEVLSFIDAKISGLPSEQKREASPQAMRQYGIEATVVISVMHAFFGESPVTEQFSKFPYLSSLCAREFLSDKWHLNHQKLFLKCMIPSNTELRMKDAYPDLVAGKPSLSKWRMPPSTFVREIRPLPHSREWVQKYIDIFKSPDSDEEVRTEMLRRLEEISSQRFGEDIWRMAEWAEAQGYDVSTPL